MVPNPFLTASWEGLLLLNYACPPELLEPLVPEGTTLDPWDGEAIISLVGFMFRNTRVRGVAVPFHRTFEEVNLRFYVLRETPEGERRRGVVFIRELVPKAAIAWVARVLYNEPYLAVPMLHSSRLDAESGASVEYRWFHQDEPFVMRGRAEGPAEPLVPGSEAEFITEHYWGYTRARDGGTREYRVEHDPWAVWAPSEPRFSGDATELYGPAFAEVLRGEPRSAFIALGGPVAVYPGSTIVKGKR